MVLIVDFRERLENVEPVPVAAAGTVVLVAVALDVAMQGPTEVRISPGTGFISDSSNDEMPAQYMQLRLNEVRKLPGN